MTTSGRTALAAALAATLSLTVASAPVAAKSHTAIRNINITMKRGGFGVHPNSLTTGTFVARRAIFSFD
jgi:uncharacterized membrane protein